MVPSIVSFFLWQPVQCVFLLLLRACHETCKCSLDPWVPLLPSHEDLRSIVETNLLCPVLLWFIILAMAQMVGYLISRIFHEFLKHFILLCDGWIGRVGIWSMENYSGLHCDRLNELNYFVRCGFWVFTHAWILSYMPKCVYLVDLIY